MPVVIHRKIREFNGILEHLQEALDDVLPFVERPDIDNVRITRYGLPLGAQCLLIRWRLTEPDSMDMGMPQARILPTLELIRPYGAIGLTGFGILAFTSTALMKPLDRSEQMVEALAQVTAILYGERDQVGFKPGVFGQDHLQAIHVCLDHLGPSTDRAERTQKMLFAEVGGMQPHLVDGVVMPEQKVAPAALQLGGQLDFTTFCGIMSHLDSTMMCLRITAQPTRQCRSIIRPLNRFCRQAFVDQGVFFWISHPISLFFLQEFYPETL